MSIRSWLKNGKRKLTVLRYLLQSKQSFKLINCQIKRIFFHFFVYPISKIFPQIKINFEKSDNFILSFSSFGIDEIKIPFNDDLLFCEIYLENCYHIATLNKGMVIVDVGAHQGFYSLIAAVKVGNEGKIIAIEPEPENYKKLLDNIKLNNFKNIIPVNLGLSDHNGIEKLYLNSSSTDHSLVKKSKNENFINIKVRTLDSLLEELNFKKIDVLKIDTEGAELLILKGAEETLRKNPRLKLFVASYHYPGEKEEVIQFLKERGFNPKISRGEIITTI